MCSRRAAPASLTRIELLNDSVRDKVSSAHATSRGIGVNAGTPFVDATRYAFRAMERPWSKGGQVRLRETCFGGQTLLAYPRSVGTRAATIAERNTHDEAQISVSHVA